MKTLTVILSRNYLLQGSFRS